MMRTIRRIGYLVVALIVGVLLTGCGATQAKRINDACKADGGLAHVSPYAIQSSGGEVVREIYCKDGKIKVVQAS